MLIESFGGDVVAAALLLALASGSAIAGWSTLYGP